MVRCHDDSILYAENEREHARSKRDKARAKLEKDQEALRHNEKALAGRGTPSRSMWPELGY